MSFTAQYPGECGHCGEELQGEECTYAHDRTIVHLACLVLYNSGVKPSSGPAIRTGFVTNRYPEVHEKALASMSPTWTCSCGQTGNAYGVTCDKCHQPEVGRNEKTCPSCFQIHAGDCA